MPFAPSSDYKLSKLKKLKPVFSNMSKLEECVRTFLSRLWKQRYSQEIKSNKKNSEYQSISIRLLMIVKIPLLNDYEVEIFTFTQI